MIDNSSISKLLSANDIGATGGHQSGILVPKNDRILPFFPTLDSTTLNPRRNILFMDVSEKLWEFSFIYYNNRLYGGTRNEYRLTKMTRFLREQGLVVGDELVFGKRSSGIYTIEARRKSATEAMRDTDGQYVLRLGGGWQVIVDKGGSEWQMR